MRDIARVRRVHACVSARAKHVAFHGEHDDFLENVLAWSIDTNEPREGSLSNFKPGLNITELTITRPVRKASFVLFILPFNPAITTLPSNEGRATARGCTCKSI